MRKLKLAKVLKALLEKHDITARELSRATKVPQPTLTNYLSGRSANKLEHLMAIAEYFNVTLEYLLFEEAPEPTLGSVLTEGVFDGWLRVRIDKAIPIKKKGGDS